MEGRLILPDGSAYTLPALLGWRLNLGCGVPCDSWSVSLPYHGSAVAVVSAARRIELWESGEVKFRGVVDESEVSFGKKGQVISLWGRGMCALLMDNQAFSRQYGVARWNEIYERHVKSYGIACRTAEGLPGIAGFRVESGENEWSVVKKWAEAAAKKGFGGLLPRFTPKGELIVDRVTASNSGALKIDGKSPAFEIIWNRKPCAVVGSVAVRNRDSLAVSTVKNELEDGKRLVYTGVGYSGVSEMTAKARDTVNESMRGFESLTLVLPNALAAYPCDTVELETGPVPGLYGVWSAESREDTGGRLCRLELRPMRVFE